KGLGELIRVRFPGVPQSLHPWLPSVAAPRLQWLNSVLYLRTGVDDGYNSSRSAGRFAMPPARRAHRLARISILGLVLCAVTGCSKGTKGDMRDMTREFNQMADIMSTINDRATLDAAKPKLTKLLASRYERQEKFRKMSADERERRQKEWEALKE